MAFKCDVCNKGIMYGHNVSHSKRRTARTFKPNLQAKRILVNGIYKKVKMCTNCIKLMGKRKEKALKEAASLVPQTHSESLATA